MKIIIPRQDLQDCVNRVKSVVSAKSALPILSHILLEAQGTSVKVSATDLKVGIECTAECTVEAEGALTVSSQRLASILSELPNNDITLALTDNNQVTLECGRIQTKLYSMAPEEFPPIRTFDEVEPVVMQQGLLKQLFNKTSFAICADPARHNLTGLLFEMDKGQLVVVSTDGRRMSLCIEKDGIPSGIEIKVIIPGKMISELQRLLTDDGDVDIYVDESQAGFAFGNIRLVTALIDGTFPPYDMVVPKKHDKEVLIDTAVFLEAVRRTRTMTNDKFNSVRFAVSSGEMSLRVVTPEVGEYREEIPIEFDGGSLEIAFNPDFVLDVLKHVETEKTSFILKDGMSPGVLKPYRENASDTYVNVIMPIRI